MHIPRPSSHISNGKDLVFGNILVQESAAANAHEEFVLGVETGKLVSFMFVSIVVFNWL